MLVVRERPRVLDGRFPDHQIKIDVSREAQLGAILCQGPPDFAPDAVLDDPEGGTWVTRSDVVDPDAPPLYIDKATPTEFPADAVIPLAQWRKALGELLATGRRPTCVDWQDSDVF